MQSRQDRAGEWIPRYPGTVRGAPLLDRERERDLARRVRSGRDAGARDELILANLRFAFSFCRRYRGVGLSQEDLVAEAHVGLIEAADRFDPERNVRFISYARFWIRRAIVRALARQAACIPLPPRQYAKLRALRETRAVLAGRLGREPDAGEVGAVLGLPGREVLDHLRAQPRVVSIEDPAAGGSNAFHPDLTGHAARFDPESRLLQSEGRDLVRSGLRDLPSRERYVLECRYGLADDAPMTLSEVSRRIGVSREMVRLIEARARERIHRRIRGRRRASARPSSRRGPAGPARSR